MLDLILDWITHSILRIWVALMVVATTGSTAVWLLVEALVNYEFPIGD